MTQKSDIGGKRLISLAPDAWVKWVTQRSDVVARAILASEFQWISRESDVLVRAYSPREGDFLVLNELQLRYEERMPRRMQAYAALAEERYNLPVYPVLINILPPSPNTVVAERYESNFMGLRARRDYRVLNLWEVEAEVAFQQPVAALIPFVPVLRGGGEELIVRRALQVLRADAQLRDLEPLLAFFASFVLETCLIQQIMRWDMIVLEQSPWYQEIIERGRAIGRAEGRAEGLLLGVIRILKVRFGQPSPEIASRLRGFDVKQLEELTDVALTADTLEAFLARLPQIGARNSTDDDGQ